MSFLRFPCHPVLVILDMASIVMKESFQFETTTVLYTNCVGVPQSTNAERRNAIVQLHKETRQNRQSFWILRVFLCASCIV